MAGGALAAPAPAALWPLVKGAALAYSAPPERGRGWWRLLRSRALSFAIVLAIGFLLMVSLVASAAIAAWGRWFIDRELLGHLLNEAVAFALATLAFAFIYKVLPRVRIRWHDVWIGAAVTAALFTLGKLLIGLYIGKSGVASGFGAASSVVVLLVRVYYSAQIFLLGAEFTRVYAEVYGSRRGRRQRDAQAR